MRDVDAGLRRALKDPVKTGRHPLRVVTVVVTIAAIVLIGGFFLRLPPLPELRSTSLQRLSREIFLLLLLLFQVLCGLQLLHGLTPLVAIHVILLHRRLQGSSVDRSLHEQRQVLKKVEGNRESEP